MVPPELGELTSCLYSFNSSNASEERVNAAISQSRSGSVGSRLIRQVLAVCDGAGRFCRGEKTSGSASAEPFGEEKERNAMHPDKKARRVSIVAGNQLESGCAVTTN